MYLISGKDESAQLQIQEVCEALAQVQGKIRKSLVTVSEAVAVSKLKAKHEYSLVPLVPKGADLYYGELNFIQMNICRKFLEVCV